MNTLSRRILGIVRTNPQKFYHVENFFYAHLDSAVELTSKYAMLVNQPLKDKDIRIALQNTRETLGDVNKQLEARFTECSASDIEKLQMEIDFVDVTMNRKKPLFEMKGDTHNDRIIIQVKTMDDLLDNPFDFQEPLLPKEMQTENNTAEHKH